MASHRKGSAFKRRNDGWRYARQGPAGREGNATHCSDGTCECGKQVYYTREQARQAATQLYPGQRMRIYTCDEKANAVTAVFHLTSLNASKTTHYRNYYRGRPA